MSASILSQLIALPEPIFTESFINDILRNPMETDEIFQCVYETIGFSLDDLVEPEMAEDMDGLDAAFLSGTFMMGILLDKYFFTPFSYYLRLIRPRYILPFDFEQELGYFVDAYESDNDVTAAFFAPCSEYTFTALGLSYFNAKPDSRNYLAVPQELPFALLEERFFCRPELLNCLPIWSNQPAYKHSQEFSGSREVYILFIKAEADAGLWLQLEVPEDYTLHRLYLEAVMRFGLHRNDEYSFFHDDVESLFTEYSPVKRFRRNNKTTDIALKDMDFSFKKNMILSAYNQNPPAFIGNPSRGGVRFFIEMLGVKPKEAGNVYPLLTAVSRKLKNLYASK
jgi:hypothetical protein